MIFSINKDRDKYRLKKTKIPNLQSVPIKISKYRKAQFLNQQERYSVVPYSKEIADPESTVSNTDSDGIPENY